MLLGKGGVRVPVMDRVRGSEWKGKWGGEMRKVRIKGEHRGGGGGVHARRERKENSENVQEFPLNRSHTGYIFYQRRRTILFFNYFPVLESLRVRDRHFD